MPPRRWRSTDKEDFLKLLKMPPATPLAVQAPRPQALPRIGPTNGRPFIGVAWPRVVWKMYDISQNQIETVLKQHGNVVNADGTEPIFVLIRPASTLALGLDFTGLRLWAESNAPKKIVVLLNLMGHPSAAELAKNAREAFATSNVVVLPASATTPKQIDLALQQLSNTLASAPSSYKASASASTNRKRKTASTNRKHKVAKKRRV